MENRGKERSSRERESICKLSWISVRSKLRSLEFLRVRIHEPLDFQARSNSQTCGFLSVPISSRPLDFQAFPFLSVLLCKPWISERPRLQAFEFLSVPICKLWISKQRPNLQPVGFLSVQICKPWISSASKLASFQISTRSNSQAFGFPSFSSSNRSNLQAFRFLSVAIPKPSNIQAFSDLESFE